MIQIYFLSILFNLIAGFALISEGDKESEGTRITRFGISFSNPGDKRFRLILGTLTMAAGVLKLLSPIQGNIIILGDLLPAAAGIVSGFILIFENNSNKTDLDDTDPEEKKESLSLVIFKNKKAMGFAAIAAAALHFVFSGIIFL